MKITVIAKIFLTSAAPQIQFIQDSGTYQKIFQI